MNPSTGSASLQFRLMGILGLTLVVGAVITLATMVVFNRLLVESAQLVGKAEALSNAWTLRNLSSRMARSQASYLLMHDQRYLRDNERYRKEFESILSRRDALDFDSRLGNLYYELDREYRDYETTFLQIQAAGEKGDWELARERAQSEAVHLASLQRSSGQLIVLLQPMVEEQLEKAVWQVRLMGIVGAVVFLAFTFLAVAAGALMDRRLTRPMRRLILAAQQIPDGQFDSAEIEPLMSFGDQLGDLTWALGQIVEQHEERKQFLEAQIKGLRAQMNSLESGK